MQAVARCMLCSINGTQNRISDHFKGFLLWHRVLIFLWVVIYFGRITYIDNDRNLYCFNCINLHNVENRLFGGVQHPVTFIGKVYPAVQRLTEMCCKCLRYTC